MYNSPLFLKLPGTHLASGVLVRTVRLHGSCMGVLVALRFWVYRGSKYWVFVTGFVIVLNGLGLGSHYIRFDAVCVDFCQD